MAGDGDPFPLASFKGEDPFPLASLGGKLVKGKGKFSAFQLLSLVAVTATGTARLNYDVKLVASSLDIFPPQYGLFFVVPDIVLPAEKPFTVEAHFFSANMIDKVICFDSDGRHEVVVDQIKAPQKRG